MEPRRDILGGALGGIYNRWNTRSDKLGGALGGIY